MGKRSSRYEETCWWNNNASNGVREKLELGKEWKQRNKSKEKYLEAKKKAESAVYQAKCKPQRKIFGKVMWRYHEKQDVFKIAKSMVKTNQDIIGEQQIRNDDGALALSDKDKKKLDYSRRSYSSKMEI